MFEYTGIRVRDLERSRRFYSAGLGLVPVARGRTATGGVWERLRDPESSVVLELNHYPDTPPYREGDELDHLAFRVGEVAPVAERLVALGGKMRIPPREEGGLWLTFLTDPDGVWIKLFERRGSDEPPTSRPMD